MPCAVKNGRTPALPSLAGLWYNVRVKLQTHHNIRGKIRKLIHKGNGGREMAVLSCIIYRF